MKHRRPARVSSSLLLLIKGRRLLCRQVHELGGRGSGARSVQGERCSTHTDLPVPGSARPIILQKTLTASFDVARLSWLRKAEIGDYGCVQELMAQYY